MMHKYDQEYRSVCDIVSAEHPIQCQYKGELLHYDGFRVDVFGLDTLNDEMISAWKASIGQRLDATIAMQHNYHQDKIIMNITIRRKGIKSLVKMGSIYSLAIVALLIRLHHLSPERYTYGDWI